MAYRIVRFDLGGGSQAYVLKQADAECCFIDDLLQSPKKSYRGKLIARTMEQVARNGTEWARISGKMRVLEAGIALYELRVNDKVIRIMTYLFDGATPVYLFDFDGHQGKSPHIPSSIMERARNLAHEAEVLMKGAPA